MKPEQMAEEKAALHVLVIEYLRKFSTLENALAHLLNKVLTCISMEDSRIAYAIYFTPDGFGQRQNIVNNAITEWLVENPIAEFPYLSLWNRINDRLKTIRGTRNLLAHGSVMALKIRDKIHVRLTPPTYSPKLHDAAEKGTLPGKSADEMQQADGGLSAMISCIETMARVLEYHDEEEQTLRETYESLVVCLTRLDSWFPDAQKIQGS